MAANVMDRADLIAHNMEKVPDEAYVSFSAATIFASIALFLVGRKDDALFVGLLGSAFATLAGIMKVLGTQRDGRLLAS
jgi:predicted small integral membrane protein